MEEGKRRPPSREQIMNHTSSENWFKERQKSAITDRQHDRAPKAHGPCSFQNLRRSNSLQTDTGQKGRPPEQPGKQSKHMHEPFPHNKRINWRASDTAKRGYRGSRHLNTEETPKSRVINISSFEVKLSDFPELCDVTTSNSKTAFSEEPRLCWSPGASPALQNSSAAPSKQMSGNAVQKQKSIHQVPSTEMCVNPLSVTPGHDIELVLPNPYGLPVTSWANIASQPPKVVQKISTTHMSSQETFQGDKETSPLQSDQTTEKKKRKKKKKSKTVSEGVEQQTDDVLIQQEPPKIEDEEEFPDLSSAFGVSAKGASHTLNSAVQENTGISEREGSSQSESMNKSKSTSGKPSQTDSKKVQLSQKKSKAPVQLDLGNMLAVLEQKQQSQRSKQDVKPLILSVGGALPVVHKDPSVQKKHPWQQERVAHNPLDSTCPLVKKGKQREVPKAKKPTPLKRIILKEREERKQNRLLEERDPTQVSLECAQTEPHAVENPCEASLLQHQLEPMSEHSEHGSEETAQTGSQASSLDNHADDDAPSQTSSPQSNPTRPKIHSRKFRDYCSQMLSKDVDECVTTLLKELVRFQDRLYQKDPMKARMRRRLVMGLREVLKHLKLRKVKCVIISPNCERVQSKGGLDEALHNIIDTCREQEVPFVFALSRKSLGRCVNKAVPVSLVGIFNYDGAQDHYHKMIQLTSQARKDYETLIANLEDNSQDQGEEAEKQQNIEPPSDPSEEEEPEYNKIWKKMLEKEYNHKFLAFEKQFSSVAISADLETLLDNHEGS
ncbi:selenocysteine insertion sequence-binding protein 2 isoform X1 [Electrophorus electricus]|uniref:selenocysteine insertion sequence-binding protein 2 isoform X1 n=1 Tax=Electrophorus electricus TaxID=8005 RepID=UPI0015D01A81|nr:selenocysteine insertion sequence-binding protein 2 isoform X1 [Electrophorus electricus]XP_026858724.2 selenocysteine insertion sequence-binding protein 2 isoform X1 [Electrophorus electricus]